MSLTNRLDGVGLIVLAAVLINVVCTIVPYALWWALTVMGWISMPFTYDVWLALLILAGIFAGKVSSK